MGWFSEVGKGKGRVSSSSGKENGNASTATEKKLSLEGASKHSVSNGTLVSIGILGFQFVAF